MWFLLQNPFVGKTSAHKQATCSWILPKNSWNNSLKPGQVHQGLTSRVQATNSTSPPQSFHWQGWGTAPHRWHYSLLRCQQLPTAQAVVTPLSPFYPSVHSLHPETTNSSHKQQICSLSQWAHTASDHILSLTDSLPREPRPAALSNLLCFYSKCNITGGNSYSHFSFHF